MTEPVAWWNGKESVVFMHEEISTPNWTDYYNIPLYTHSQPKREWVGLTPEELSAIWDSMGTWNSTSAQHFYNAIWKAIKEKNT